MSSILLGSLSLSNIVIVIVVGKILLTVICQKKRSELIRVLESDTPEFYQALGSPGRTIWQQLFRRRDCLANDRLRFYALFRAGIFPNQPRVHTALVGYRRLQIVNQGFFVLFFIVGGLFIYSVRR